MIQSVDELLRAATGISTRRVLVVFPDNQATFAAIGEAHGRLGLQFTLVGRRARIEASLPSLAGIEIVDCSSAEESLDASVELLGKREADILMKGSVDTGALIKAALQPSSGLRTGRLMSDVFLFEYGSHRENKLVMITDGGLNIAPDLDAKAQLIRNAVEVAHALGNTNPKVAVLAAAEFVQPNMPATLDAAALTRMNQCGEISGCTVFGPLALDIALDGQAAREKQIDSPVAGAAEILVCPNIECANALAKSTTYIGHARLAHVIVGARIPILIPSRADTRDAKLSSLALGAIMSQRAQSDIR